MPHLVGAGAVVIEVEPQAGDADDVVGLAACAVVAGSLAPDAEAEVAVLLQVEFGEGGGDGKPDGLAAWGVEDGEPAGCRPSGIILRGAFLRLLLEAAR